MVRQARNIAGRWGEPRTLSLTTLSTEWCRWYDRAANYRKQKGAKGFPGGFQNIFTEDMAIGLSLEGEFLPGRERFWKNCPRHVNGQKRWCVVLPRDAEWHTVGQGWDLWLVSYWSGYLHREGVNNFRKTESHKWFLFIKIKVFMFSKDTIDFYPVQMWWLYMLHCIALWNMGYELILNTCLPISAFLTKECVCV